MEIGFLQLLRVSIFNLSEKIAHIDVAPPPTDVPQPPIALLGGLGLGVLAALCCLVVVVAVVAFFVIRGIKKNRTKDAAPAQTPPADSNP